MSNKNKIANNSKILEQVMQNLLSLDSIPLKYDGKKTTISGLTQEMIFVISQSRDVLFVNSFAAQSIGRTMAEIIGKNLKDIFRQQEFEKFNSSLELIFKTAQPYTIDDKMQLNNKSIWLSTRLVPIIDKGIVAAVLGVSKDITSQRLEHEALLDSEYKYKLLINTCPDAVIVTDTKGSITFVSDQAVELFGFDSNNELLGKNVFNLIIVNDKNQPSEFIAKAIKEEIVRGLEYEFIKKDGTAFVGELNASLMRDAEGAPKAFIGITRDISSRKKIEKEIQESCNGLQKTLDGVIKAMVRVVEIKDPYTAGHQRRVAQLSGDISLQMGLPENQINSICVSALIHDIGKIYVPSEILTKPSMLTEVEFNIIKVHAQASYDILKVIEFPWPVASIVLQHHERINGSGYPFGLTKDSIMLEAKILGIADVVEAITFQRPYRAALGLEKALEEIIKNKNVLYDPDVVEACLKVFSNKGYKFD